jgi:hypothetical protein
VLHWARGAGGKIAVLTGDIIQVVPDRKHGSFMPEWGELLWSGRNDEIKQRLDELGPLPPDR